MYCSSLRILPLISSINCVWSPCCGSVCMRQYSVEKKNGFRNQQMGQDLTDQIFDSEQPEVNWMIHRSRSVFVVLFRLCMHVHSSCVCAHPENGRLHVMRTNQMRHYSFSMYYSLLAMVLIMHGVIAWQSTGSINIKYLTLMLYCAIVLSALSLSRIRPI